MDMRRTHDVLTSFVVSLMLTSAFLASTSNDMNEAAAGPQPQAIMNALNSLRASGWAGTQDLTMPSAAPMQQSAMVVPAATPPESVLTAAQKKKISMLMDVYGKAAVLHSDVTAALGISKGDEVLTLRSLADLEAPLLHAYIPLPDGGILLGLREDGVMTWNYRLDADLKLIAAVSKGVDQAPVVIPMADATRNAQAEIIFWAALADKH
jgi:hypothetical protein